MTTVMLATNKGLLAPARSLTDSIMLPDGALLRAKNCTYLPRQQLALWRPLFKEKIQLTVMDTETVIAACKDCDYLAFITKEGTTYRQYLYRYSQILNNTVTVSPKNTVSVTDENTDASVVFGGGYAYYAIEGHPVTMIRLEDEKIFYGGAVLYTEAGSSSHLVITPSAGLEAEITQFELHKDCELFKISLFFARSNPKLFGKALLKVYVNGTYVTSSVNVVYFGSLPDTLSSQPIGNTGYYPVEFELVDKVEVTDGDVVDIKLQINDYTASDGTNEIYVESCGEKHSFLGNLTGNNVHIHVNGVHSPKGGFCTYGQGRVFIAEEDGDVFSADPLYPSVFDGYVTTGLSLTGLACYNNMVIAFSENKCSVITGVWPDMLEGVDEKSYGVNCQQGFLNVEDTLFLAQGGVLAVFGQAPLANPFLAEPTIKSYLNFYKRLNILIMTLRDEGKHAVFQLNGLLTTTWHIDEVADGDIILIVGDYALFTNGKFYEMVFEVSEVTYEVEVLTKAVDCGKISEFDRVHVLSGCNGPGTVTLLYCCDCADNDNWIGTNAMLPYSQWEEASLDFPGVPQETHDDSAIIFGDGIATAIEEVAPFYRHPVNCFALKNFSNGWAIAVDLKLAADAPKTVGTLLGGFIVSITNQKPRVGFAI